MNEPLTPETIERYRDCTAPRVPAVEEMADSHELMRAQRDEARARITDQSTALRDMTAAMDRDSVEFGAMTARVAGLEAKAAPIANALRKAEALIESEFTSSGMAYEELCEIKAEPALTAVRRALAALSADPLKVGEAVMEVVRVFGEIQAEMGEETREQEAALYGTLAHLSAAMKGDG